MSAIQFDEEHFVAAANTPIADASTQQGLLQSVCHRFDVTLDELLGTERLAHIVRARHFACWLLRQHGLSYPAIARVMGGRDHTTVLSAVRKIERQRAQRPDVARALDEIRGAA